MRKCRDNVWSHESPRCNGEWKEREGGRGRGRGEGEGEGGREGGRINK